MNRFNELECTACGSSVHNDCLVNATKGPVRTLHGRSVCPLRETPYYWVCSTCEWLNMEAKVDASAPAQPLISLLPELDTLTTHPRCPNSNCDGVLDGHSMVWNRFYMPLGTLDLTGIVCFGPWMDHYWHHSPALRIPTSTDRDRTALCRHSRMPSTTILCDETGESSLLSQQAWDTKTNTLCRRRIPSRFSVDRLFKLGIGKA